MRIKKIELIGFKSFKDRTVIHFDAGITGIVGPNGCGKSNIVDGLVWVMGEMSAKDLRGSSMTDVIFAGAEGYAPSGMAEVSLTLENDGGAFPAKYLKHSEIMVTRRLHRNGESEYLINKEQARLKDIQEIFMDTGAGSKGFSIIQQGMIGKIITAKPEDRRMLIEEAAGITKFKARKKESQRKLEATDQNLVRLADIIGEKKRSIESLQRQAQKAERYRQLKKEIEDLDLWISSIQFKDLSATSSELQRTFSECQTSETSEEVRLREMKADLEVRKLAVLEHEKEVEVLQQEQFDLQGRVQKQELEIQSLRFEIEQARSREEMTGNLLQEQGARRDLLEREALKLDQETVRLQREHEVLKKDFDTKKEAYDVVQSRINEIDEELTTVRRELFALGQSESSLDAKVQSIRNQLEDLQSRSENEIAVLGELKTKKLEIEERRRKLSAEYDQERQMQLDLQNDVESFEVNRKILTEQIGTKRTEVDEFKDQLNQVASRLYGLQNLHNSFEGFEEGVKQVMLWQRAKQAEITADGSVHFQPVSEIVEVPSEYELAMEAALGNRLQTLVSKGSDSAIEAVQYLKQENRGRSSFLPNSAELTPSMATAADGLRSDGRVVALLSEVVRCEGEFSNSAKKLLERIAVVDSIHSALALRPEYSDWSFVTKDGDVLSADGVLTGGGADQADSGVLQRRREMKELSAAKEEWAGKLGLAQASLKKLEAQLENVISDFEGAKTRKVEQEIKVATLRKDLERAETEIQNADYACQKQEREILKFQDQVQQLEVKEQEMSSSLQDVRAKRAEADETSSDLTQELDSSRIGIDSLRNEVMRLQGDSSAKNSEWQGALKQHEIVKRQLADLIGQLDRMSEESLKNGSFVSENQILLEERKLSFEKAVRDLEEVRKSVARLRDTYEIELAAMRKIESETSEIQKARNENMHRMTDAQLKFEQAKMKEQYLIEQIRERYMLDLPSVYINYVEKEGNPKESEGHLKDLKDRLNKIGDVNLSAIEEYEETAKSYEFLVQQQTDLIDAKEQLRRVIDRINRICSKRFKETFDLVNERFSKVFPVLFGGGEARLELFEDVDRGEMGIDIIARPPGKKAQNISLLSGGEKALTAVSLVFSIFLVKPSPYCLLDEVDAPLDDANVYRFNDLVREMAKRSQIIVVTHNKHTMEVAKKLYGVTQQERGVSTMVSVNLADVN